MALKLSKKLLCASVYLLINSTSFAQNNELELPATVMRDVEVIVIGEKKEIAPIEDFKPFNRDILNVVDARDGKSYRIMTAPTEEVQKRLASLENIMPLTYNDDVQKYIDYFTLKRPSFTREMLERKERYFPVFEKYLAKNHMPDELKYLSLLESGLNPKAISRSKAVGLWQFMSPTGREMGLTINDVVDERMHIEKSTDAACKYLKQLYNSLGDWDLALASYNTGPGNIRRAMRKSGRSNYWDIHPYIHRDTRAYVPQFISLIYLMNYSAELGIFPEQDKMEFPDETESILLQGYTDLTKLADCGVIDYNEIMRLNPHLKVDKIPAHYQNFEIKIPRSRYAYFEENHEMILKSASIIDANIQSEDSPTVMLASNNNVSSNGEIVIGQRPSVENSEPKSTTNIVSYRTESKKVKLYHRVNSGDHLSNIADRYNVSVSDLKEWNHLKSSKILKGQKLAYYKTETRKVPVYGEQTAIEKLTENKNAQLTNDTKDTESVKTNTAKVEKYNTIEDLEPSKTNYVSTTNTVKRFHKVVSGDNLTNIANKYNVSISDLKDWNNMKTSKVLKGQKLVYYTTITQKSATASNSTRSKNPVVYVVQKGDTLWNIAQRYDGITVEQLKKLNNLTDNNVKVGQKLKVKG